MTRPNVLLINPRICSPASMRMPLSLLSLAAVLEGQYSYEMLDGNLLPNLVGSTLDWLARTPGPVVAGISVMPGPQVAPAILISTAIRRARPDIPIIWGGYFPSLYPDAAINAPYVDVVVRGPGEESLLQLLAALPDAGRPGEMQSVERPESIRDILGITYKENGRVVHTAPRPFQHPDRFPPYPYHRLPSLDPYLQPTFMNNRTASHQVATGCRYRCGFCGVVSVYDGHTDLGGPERMVQALGQLQQRYGANAVQFYDNNFFDRENTAIPLLEALVPLRLPWWCYARADTMAHFSAKTWDLLRKSQLRMAYIGAEAGSDAVLKSMKKGTKVEHTLEVAAKCKEYGIIPEFSFVLGGPEDAEGEVERSLSFVKQIKQAHPESEIILYFYSPTPQRAAGDRARGLLPALSSYGPQGPSLPTTPEEWAEDRWVRYVCHQDAPWLSPRMRQRVEDFSRVLACRFPTMQDHRTSPLQKAVLRRLAGWRYRSGYYSHSYELELARRLIALKRPEREGL